MLRHLLVCTFAVAVLSVTAQAGDYYHFPAYAFSGPPVYAVPVVSYQPAYVVPTAQFVATYPVTTVAYSTQYYAPMVPIVPAYYAPARVVSPVYVAPGYYGRHGRYRSLRRVEVEFERDGDIEIDYRYR